MKSAIEFVKWQFGKHATWAEESACERITELLCLGWMIENVSVVPPQEKFDQPGYHITMMVRRGA